MAVVAASQRWTLRDREVDDEETWEVWTRKGGPMLEGEARRLKEKSKSVLPLGRAQMLPTTNLLMFESALAALQFSRLLLTFIAMSHVGALSHRSPGVISQEESLGNSKSLVSTLSYASGTTQSAPSLADQVLSIPTSWRSLNLEIQTCCTSV